MQTRTLLLRRGLAPALAALCASASACAAPAGSGAAPAPAVPGEVPAAGAYVFTIRPQHVPLERTCLDVKDRSHGVGALLQQWGCWGGENQRFLLRREPGVPQQLVAVHSRKCLTMGARAPGAPVYQAECEDRADQRFVLVGRAESGWQIRVAHTGLCLDVSNESWSDGASIIQYDCTGRLNQRFKLHVP